MQKRLEPERGVNKPFENVFMSGAYSDFFPGGGTDFRHFFSIVFFFIICCFAMVEITAV